MSTSEITEEERQGAQHLASLMNLALGSAAGDVGSHQQEAQAAQEARVRGLLSSAAQAVPRAARVLPERCPPGRAPAPPTHQASKQWQWRESIPTP